MGKGMKAGNKPTGEKIVISTREYRRIMQESIEHAMDNMLLITIGYLMEEPEFHYDIKRIEEYVNGVNRYADALADRSLDFKMNDLAKVISDKTGTKIRWIR